MSPAAHRLRAARIVLFLSAAAFPGWSGGAPKRPARPQVNPRDMVWPLPPAAPRVRWLAQITDLDTVRGKGEKKQSWAERIAGAKRKEEQRLRIKRPYGIAADSHGRIYVADSAQRVVFVLDQAGHSVEARRGSGRAPIALPIGLAVDDKDRLFVSDSFLHTITCFAADGQLLSQFGGDKLVRAAGLAVDSQRHRLYVADAKANRVAVFDSERFTFERYIGGPSTEGVAEPGLFSLPTNVAVDPRGNLYVVDTFNHRVQVFDATGKVVRAWGRHGDRPGSFVRPKGIAVDSQGHVYVADSEFNNFQIFTPEGRPLLAVGTLGSQPGEFLVLGGIFVDREDRILTTEMNGRVQVFQYLPEPGAAVKEVSQAKRREQ